MPKPRKPALHPKLCQRACKISTREVIEKRHKKSLYLLDEPTTGLHSKDIETLLKLMNHMVTVGHTIILTEHNQDIIRHADYIIELGPEGGGEGGYLIK